MISLNFLAAGIRSKSVILIRWYADKYYCSSNQWTNIAL